MPVIIVTVAEPLLVLQLALTVEVETVGEAIVPTTALAVTEHPPVPVTVTV